MRECVTELSHYLKPHQRFCPDAHGQGLRLTWYTVACDPGRFAQQNRAAGNDIWVMGSHLLLGKSMQSIFSNAWEYYVSCFLR